VKVNGAKGVVLDIRGPQLGERLSHRTDGVFHFSRSDGFLQGSLSAISIPLYRYLDDGRRVFTVLDERINGARQAELFPTSPMYIRCSGMFISDPNSGLFLDKAKISA
jgi:hypothetical protein